MQNILVGSDNSEMNEYPPVHFETSNNVVVPVNDFMFNETVVNRITQNVDPLTDDGNHGIQLFLSLVNSLNEQECQGN